MSMTRKEYNNKKNKNAQGKSTQEIYLAKHIHFEHIDSTNTWAKLHSDQWDSKGLTLITASEQSAGRGRFKRHWVSPPNLNIYATFCFWFDLERTDIGHIPQVLAISAAQTLESQGFSPAIKWPNDLLLQDKKVAGILCETILEHNLRGIVCGIGLNVNMPAEILNQIDRPATSLLVEGGHFFDVNSILALLQEKFLNHLNQFLQAGFIPLFPLLQTRSALKQGQRVRFHDNQTLIDAQFEHLHPDGSVELRLSNGMLKIFHAGEFLQIEE
jgi:BirA family biotin operon repressor/biotin-[acetyl-CoA-carboxylase] ligase